MTSHTYGNNNNFKYAEYPERRFLCDCKHPIQNHVFGLGCTFKEPDETSEVRCHCDGFSQIKQIENPRYDAVRNNY